MWVRVVLLFCCLMPVWLCSAQAKLNTKPPLPIKVNPGKYADYYHLNFTLPSGHYRVNQEYGFNRGGQFEVLVDKAYFPIAAPNCRQHIIIRMPYSVNEAKKRTLYQALVTGQSFSVILELNPYVKRLTRTKEVTSDQFELTHCNVFFRHKSGDYFDQL